MTEQLSAYLDKQPLSAEEQSQVEAHLKTCELCQQELADLRQTVALLHALPQPALPRSFVLPLDIHVQTSVEDEHAEAEPVPIAVAAARRRRHIASASNRGWPTYARVALRTVSAIAAVVGLVLFLSGMITSFSTGGTMTAASSNQPMAANNKQDANTNVSSGQSASGSAAAPQTSPSSRATITPPAATPEATSAASPEATPAATTAITRGITPEVRQAQQPPNIEPSRPPIILFFDLSTGPGRLGFGFLLLLLGVMGYIVFKRRWRQERA
jgi:anti-sigma factor RsiW